MCSSKLSLGWRTTRIPVRHRNATVGTSAPQTADLAPGRPSRRPAGAGTLRSACAGCRRRSAGQPSSGRNPRSASRRGSMSSCRMVVDPLVERQPADDAQAGAVRAAQRGDRLGQLDRLTDRRLEIELVVVGQAGDVGLVVGRTGRPVAMSSEGRNSSWSRSSTGRTTSRRQRLHSRSSAVVRSAVGEDPAVRAEQADAALDRGRQAQVLAEVDRDVRGPRSARSAPGSSASRPATFHASGPSTGPPEVTGSSATAPPRPPRTGRRPRRPGRRRRPRARRDARRGARSPS